MNTRTINELEYVPRKKEPDAKWAAVVSLSLGVFGLVTAEFLPVSLLTPLSTDLSISSGIAGQSITVTALVAAVAGPGVVIGTRSIDRRWTLLGLTMLLIISSTLAAFANGLFMLFASRVLLGIGLGGFWAMSAALALRLVPLDKMPRAMAIILTGVSVATVCAAPVGAWIGATLGWRAAFVVAGVLGVIALLVQLLTVPSLPPAGAPGLSTMFRLLQRPQVRIGLL
ncbi:MFS transporter, partial [Rhizobium sp.]